MHEQRHLNSADGHSQPPAHMEHVNQRAGYPAYAGAPAMSDDGDGEEFPLYTYWRIVLRNKRALVLAGALGAICGILLSLPQTPVYRSQATIEIQGINDGFLGFRDVNPTQDGGGQIDSDIATHVEILESRTLVSSVSKRMAEDYTTPPGVAATPQSWMATLGLEKPKPLEGPPAPLSMAAAQLKAIPSRDSRIIKLSTESTDRVLAATFVNEIAEQFITASIDARWEATQHTEDWLERQLDDLRGKLEESEDRLQASAQASGLVFTSETSNVEEQQLEQIQERLSDARAERIEKQSKFELASSSPPESLPDVLDSGPLSQYQLELNSKRQRLANLSTTFTESYPEVKRLNAEIAELEQTMKRESGNIIARIENEYQGAVRRERLLENDYDKQAVEVSDQARKAIQYNILKREVETNRQLYETLLQKGKEARLAAAMKASPVRIVDHAIPTSRPIKPNHTRNTMLGLAMGLMVGVVFVIGRDRVDRTFKNPGDIEFYLAAQELGFIPSMNAARSPGKVRVKLTKAGLGRKKLAPSITAEPKGLTKIADANGAVQANGGLPDTTADDLVAWKEPLSWPSECVRATLTSILFSGSNGDVPRRLVITSASPAEGKSTVAGNLAVALAEINQSVLLIDADMRRPRQHEIFGVDNNFGLSDLLRHRTKLDKELLRSMTTQSSVPGISVLSSGPGTNSISNLLHSDRSRELLTVARESFDWVLIDTPPMSQLADGRLLGRLSDAVVLVVKAGSTTRDSISACENRLRKDGTRVLGVVLNQWNPKNGDSGYYKDYYRYRSYYDRQPVD